MPSDYSEVLFPRVVANGAWWSAIARDTEEADTRGLAAQYNAYVAMLAENEVVKLGSEAFAWEWK